MLLYRELQFQQKSSFQFRHYPFQGFQGSLYIFFKIDYTFSETFSVNLKPLAGKQALNEVLFFFWNSSIVFVFLQY